MYNEKSRKNLKKFSSKNQPKKRGRPKGSFSLTNALNKVMATEDPASDKLVFELFVTAGVKHAIKGNAAYFKEIFERLEGKVTDKVEQTGKFSGPVTLTVRYENRPKLADSDKSEEKDMTNSD
jgi:hypothetical protein